MKMLLLLCFLTLLVSCNSDANFVTGLEEQKFGFTKSINRISSNFDEYLLILKAEMYYPPRDSILNLPYRLKDLPEKNCWYFMNFDNILLPYAITAEAIMYYSNLMDTLVANKGIYHRLPNYLVSFKYKAEVKYYDKYFFESDSCYTVKQIPSAKFENVYVVDMYLHWENHCGSACALYINHKRIVVFDKNGNLLKIFYDGLSRYEVS